MDDLAKCIEFEFDSGDWADGSIIPSRPPYAAAWALAEIGGPSTAAMLRILADEDSRPRRRAAVWVRQRVHGTDAARSLITRERDAATADHARRRLDDAVRLAADVMPTTFPALEK